MPGFNEIIVVLIVFTAPAIPILVIGMVYFYKKKLEHKTILAAIEKGVPISELNLGTPKQKKNDGPGWIKDQSTAITLLIIGVGIGVAFYWFLGARAEHPTMNVMWIVPVVFLGNGIGLLIRSIQRKKYEKDEPADETAEQV